jgi:hypothetical protein
MKDTNYFYLKHLTKMTFLAMRQNKQLVKKVKGPSKWPKA